MIGGRGVQLAESSGVRDGSLLLCVDTTDTGTADSLVRLASRVEAEWLDQQLITTSLDVDFDVERERVRVLRRQRYLGLVLDERPTNDAASDETARVLYEHARARLERVLPKDDRDFDQFLARVRSLRQWMPELDLPPLDDDQLREVLRGLCEGRRGFDDLRKAPWTDFARGLLTYQQCQALDREAPERISIPRGNRVRLRYEPGRPPVLSVRIQELFGLMQTPRIAAGRVAVLLELLGPNMRPQQLTDDLPSFWKNTYPVIRKELRRRYPKHDWPETPI
jgi:ATP-dependent helicase HrpB